MSEQTSTIVSKVWGMCGPLRDDGVSYGDYLEQITYLIFLKMAEEYSKPPYKRDTGIPAECTWSDMSSLKGAELEEKYKSILEKLGEQGGILGKIFKGATNKISNAAILYRVVHVFCKTFLHKIAKTFCRLLQLHFVGNCKPDWQAWYLPAI